MIQDDESKILELFYKNYDNNPKNIYLQLNKKVPLKKIKDIIDNVKSNVTKKQENNYITIANPNGTYQCDLTFYTNIKKINSGYHVILNFINTNSKYLYSYLLKDKKKETINKYLQKFLIDCKKDCKIIQCDDGSEFKNNVFKKICNDDNIKIMYFNKLKSPNAISICERVNKSIRDLITNYQEKNNNKRFVDIFDKIIEFYNNRVHSTIKMKPIDVNEKQEKQIANNNMLKKYDDVINSHDNFKIGSYVKLIINRELFQKGPSKKLSKQVYQVVNYENNKIIIKDDENNKIYVFPRQLKLINKKYDLGLLNNIKSQMQNKIIKKDKKEKRQKRMLKKEGLDIDLDKQKKLNRLKKQLN